MWKVLFGVAVGALLLGLVLAGLRSNGAPAAPASATPTVVSAGQPFTVSITASSSDGATPTIAGATNLPDVTILWVQLSPPHPDCIPTCFPFYPATAKSSVYGGEVVVRNGAFTAGPDWTNLGATWKRADGAPGLPSGTYVLEVRIPADENDASDPEPATVQAILGAHDENARGPLVGTCCFAEAALYGDEAAKRDAAETHQMNRDPSMGPGIYYARYVDVTSTAPNPPPIETAVPDGTEIARNRMIAYDESLMASCIEQYSPDLATAGSRAKIRAAVLNLCVNNRAGDGFMTPEIASAFGPPLVDQELDRLLGPAP